MGKVYYFTDIHGELPLFNAIMNYCSNDSLIIFGGDAIDRGKDGYKIMTELLNNPRVIYLKGNHEDMFVAAVREFKQHFPNPQFNQKRLEQILAGINTFDYKYPAIQLFLYNGGKPTFLNWFNDGMPMDIIKQLENLPITFSYNNLDFCHAGGVYKSFIHKNRQDRDFMLWDRGAFEYGWTPNRICVHGHTPVAAMPRNFQNMTKENITPLKYCGKFAEEMTGYKINMDTGVYWSKRIFVLNCNTLITTGFLEDEQHIIKQIETLTL